MRRLAATLLTAILTAGALVAPAVSFADDGPVPMASDAPVTASSATAKAKWQGFFLSLNVGYSTHGGEAGVAIPDPSNGLSVNGNSFAQWKAKDCLFANQGCYSKAVTTARGDGLAAALQIGYNILGYASIWADFAWNGSFGSTVDNAGVGTVSMIAAIHPLRFWRPDAPFDVKLYGGYGFFEILYYYESEFQTEAEGKAWTGTAIPFGLAGEWRVPDSVFALGLDLRFVRGSYTKWIYNNDKDIASDLSADPVTTFRFAPRVTFGWHF